jgi:hypothetical protein
MQSKLHVLPVGDPGEPSVRLCHIETKTKRAALDKLPDVTAPANTPERG